MSIRRPFRFHRTRRRRVARTRPLFDQLEPRKLFDAGALVRGIDLVGQMLTANPLPDNWGQQFNANWTICNQGDTAVPAGGFELRFVLSTDTAFDAGPNGDIVLSSVNVFNQIGPGGSASGATPITLPDFDDLPQTFPGSGPLFILMVVDAGNVIAEADETNNSGQAEGVDTVAVDIIGEPVSLTGRVFDDTDGDGLFDANEDPLPGWTVFIDLNDDGVLDESTEPFTLSDADGRYRFDDQDPGTFIVRQQLQAGWTQTRPVLPGGAPGRYVVTLRGQDEATGLDFGNQQGFHVEIGSASDVNELRFTDPDGTLVTIKITVGRGSVSFTGQNLDADQVGRRFEVTGFNIEVVGIGVATNGGARIDIRTDRGGDRMATVGDVNVFGNLAQLNAKTTDVTGTFVVSGIARKVDMHDATAGSSFRFGGEARGVGEIDLRFNRVADLRLTSATPMRKLDVAEWINTTGQRADVNGRNIIITPSINQLNARRNRRENTDGDFHASLQLDGESLGAVALNRVNIDGMVVNADWRVDGEAGPINVKGAVAGWDLAVDSYRTLNLTDVSDLTLSLVGEDGAGVGQDGDGGTIKAWRWIGGGFAGGSLRGMTITGRRPDDIAADLDIDMQLTGNSNARRSELGRVRAGDLLGGNWQINGSADGLAVDSTAIDWSLSATDEVKTIAVKNDASGQVTARVLNRMTVRGDARDLLIELTRVSDPNRVSDRALAALTVNGTMQRFELRSFGHVGNITAGAIRDSLILVGVQPTVTELPDSPDDFLHEVRLNGLNVRGQRDAADDFANTIVAAWSMGNVNLRRVATMNGGEAFGVAANAPRAVSFETAAGRIRLSRADDFAAFEPMDDFDVRVIDGE
jgi:hypothetical protein